ncbi:hypothetical protein EDC02_2177 [Micromonospora sp. Llam0]|uniref:hypothetical protein n=1 Tax=Micromonospora sp. Llam0 TaxID=2485143 RepID=UPI000F491087|nr:hypothetical protein [Micromonospora sp. Llam0]ROO60316.1 hypothetical protein EDC02_2177 [Micromonospora sp. Llam0]
MTTRDDHSRKTKPDATSTTPDSEAQFGDDAIAAALVPIAVWRLDDSSGDSSEGERDASFASRLARRLIEIYTDPHEVVADFDGDPHLNIAAEAAARTYRAITSPALLSDHEVSMSPATLVVWRWPRDAVWPSKPTTLFAACRLITDLDGCVIAAVRSAEPGQAGASHAEHMARLLPVAQAAGFDHVLQIVAVGGCDTGDQFLYHATSGQAADAADDPAAADRVCHIDLLAFTR